MKKYFIALLFFFVSINGTLQAQLPFQDEINDFKKADSINPPPKHAILFVGSSSFRKWENVQQDFPGYTIINRGFGGSTLPDIINFADNIIFPYEPKQVVIYCGENDLASEDSVTAHMVADRFKALFFLIRDRLPDVPIIFISIKPSPIREKLLDKIKEANKEIKVFIKGRTNVEYVDVFHRMMRKKNSIRDDVFINDKLHMNEKGYAIWKEILSPYLLK